MEPMAIDLNEEFDRYDAMADAFFERHPPRVTVFELSGTRKARVQLSLLEGIWIELEWNEPGDDPCMVHCDNIVDSTFCVLDAITELRKKLEEMGESDHFKEIAEWLPKNWTWYVNSRKHHERVPKSPHDQLMIHVQERLEDELSKDRPYLHFFHDDMNCINESTRIGMSIIFGDGRDPPRDGDECFGYQDGECTRFEWHGDDFRKCSFQKSIGDRMTCGAYIAWKKSVEYQLRHSRD